jgi:hypothetical protein
MILQVPIRCVHCLPDAVQVGMTVSRTRRTIRSWLSAARSLLRIRSRQAEASYRDNRWNCRARERQRLWHGHLPGPMRAIVSRLAEFSVGIEEVSGPRNHESTKPLFQGFDSCFRVFVATAARRTTALAIELARRGSPFVSVISVLVHLFHGSAGDAAHHGEDRLCVYVVTEVVGMIHSVARQIVQIF